MDEETECRSLYFSMDLVWIIRGFFLINHGNTHHSDTYTHTYSLIGVEMTDHLFSLLFS